MMGRSPARQPADAPAVVLDDVVFEYKSGGFQLSVPALAIDAGTCTAVIGPSGSGKTTLLHVIAGILTPLRGTVSVGEVVVSSLNDAARRRFRIGTIGMVFQDFGLVDYLNVRENVLLPYFIHGAMTLDGGVRARLEELADTLGVGALLSRRVTRLSQGERQRVALCRALLPRPELILADEPTGNVEPTMKSKLVAMLIEQAKSHGSTLVMVTHDHSVLERFDRTIDFASFARAE